MIETVRVSSKGQVVIPEAMRNELKIKEGTKLIVVEKNNKLIIELEEEFLKRMNNLEDKKESYGWMGLAEKGLTDIWDNETDDKEWKKYM